MRNLKKVTALILAVVMVLALVSCKKTEGQDTPNANPTEGLGDATIIDNSTLEHTKDFAQEETVITSHYSDLGENISADELNTKYLEYIAPIKDALLAEGLFTDLYDDDSGDTYRALQAFDPTTRYVYNLFCHVDGYQGVRMAVTLYKIEHTDWESFDFSELAEVFKQYIGLVINPDDITAARSEILERVEEGKGFSVYIESEKGERTVCVSVMEYGTDYECWTIDAFSLVTPGANFYNAVDDEVSVEGEDVDDTASSGEVSSEG